MTEATDPRWARVCRVDELEPGRPLGRVLGDDEHDRVCVVAHGDLLVAVLDRCPHRDIALSGGIVDDGQLVCPGHFWRFHITTGQRVDEPTTALTRYATRVVDGWVEALIAPAPSRGSMRTWLLAEAAARRGGDVPVEDDVG